MTKADWIEGLTILVRAWKTGLFVSGEIMTENTTHDSRLNEEFAAWDRASDEALLQFENSLPDESYEIAVIAGGYARIKRKRPDAIQVS